MATNTQLINKPFSRQLNGLAELQRWWPTYVKADGIGGLTVDPILLATSFGPDPENADGRRHDESTMPGIRVEALNDSGSIPSEQIGGVTVYPRVLISGSGGFNPKCSLLTPDGSPTSVLLIAPSAERKAAAPAPSVNTPASILDDIKSASPGSSRHSLVISQADLNKPGTTGPYPVFMTVQELAEWIDTARHATGSNDNSKQAWLPHGIIGREVASTNARVAVDADPRITTNNDFSNNSYWRATVFMPMMLDVNQFSSTIQGGENANATKTANTIGGHAQGTYLPNCVTRYPGNQTDLNNAATPANNVQWKTFNYSGDHLTGVNYGGTKETLPGVPDYPGFQNIDISNDSTASVGPKYRMKMALACFLKDGTYEANEGVIIPYTYDPTRYLGGTTTTTLYTVWDGDNGYGSPVDGTYDSTNYRPHQNDKSAQVYPMFDFVQGPFAPSAQGTNWAYDVLVQDYHKAGVTSFLPRQAHTRPNPQRFEIAKVTWLQSSSIFRFWLFGGFAADNAEGVAVTPGSFMRGDSIFVEGLTGVWGNPAIANRASEKWPARFEKGRGNQAEGDQFRDFNGWWLIRGATSYTESSLSGNYPPMTPNEVDPNFPGTRFASNGNAYWWKVDVEVPEWATSKPESSATSYYTTAEGELGYVCQGRIGGFMGGFPEMGSEDWSLAGDDITGSISDTADAQNFWLVEKSAQNYPLSSIGGGVYSAASHRLGTGYHTGLAQASQNTPIGGSMDDTYPGRPTLSDYALKDDEGNYAETRKVLRPIHTVSSTNDTNMSAPNQYSYGGGALRIPSPLGWDLSDRYNCLGSVAGGLNTTTDWVLRTDLGRWSNEVNLKDRWGFRGIHTPLWSYMEHSTGKHAWNEIKPNGWSCGRNRPWPGHERLGTRMAWSPGLLNYDTAATGDWSTPSPQNDYVTFGTETTLYGLSEMACSPMWLDFEMIAYVPQKANRMTIIEFDSGEDSAWFGKHAMISDIPNRNLGFGISPIWDGSTQAIFQRPGYKDLSGAVVDVGVTATPAAMTTFEQNVLLRFIEDNTPSPATLLAVDEMGIYGDSALWHNTNLATGGLIAGNPYPGTDTVVPDGFVGAFDYGSSSPEARRFPPNYTTNRPAIWMSATPTHWTSPWTGADEFTLPGLGGFGMMGSGFGMGGTFSYTGGTNTVRAVFNEGGMTLIVNGTEAGTDPSVSSPIYGISIKSADVLTFPNRVPIAVSGTTTVPAEYSHLWDQEPITATKVANQLTGLYAPIDSSKFIGTDSTGKIAGAQNLPQFSGLYPGELADTNDYMTSVTNPGLQGSNEDLTIDRLTLRHLPSVAMLPFPVYTKKQLPVSNIARWTKLVVNCENINLLKGMNLTISLYEPVATVAGMSTEPSTPIANFEDLQFDWVGDEGEIDLTTLPASALTDGFVACFQFHIPNAGQTEYHPINWSKTPLIRWWETKYDIKPDVDIEVIGNTYDGSTASSATADNDFNTKVGHVITYRVTGSTTDTDRLISDVKVDFGDGTVTDWIPQETPATTLTYDVAHVYTTRPASPYQYSITAYSRDNSENESVASTPAIVATVVAAQPVAILRAIPQLVRAGQAVKLDGTDSYSIDTDATISTYTFNFGDGSSAVSGASSSTDHTYAEAGEFLATLAVIDSNTQTSALGKVVVKVLPATLVVPLDLNTRPHKFTRMRSASFSTTAVLDAVYPEMTDLGQRQDEFALEGSFLKATANDDIAFMEELLFSGSLVEFEWEAVNYSGTPTGKTFVGRMTDFTYDRAGGKHGETPYQASFIHEAGLGA